MAFTFGVGNTGAAAGNITVIVAGMTAGRHVVLGVQSEAAVASITCTGETVTLLGTDSNSGTGLHCRFAECILSGGGSKTFVTTGLSGNGDMFVQEIVEACTFDNSANATGSSGTDLTVSLTVAANNSLVFGQIFTLDDTIAAGSGYTKLTMPDDPFAAAEYTLDSGASGARAVNFTVGSTTGFALQAASWSPTGGDVLMPQIWM